MDRISRSQMFMEIAQTISKRSSCKKGQVGSVIIRDNRIISMGYNGAPTGFPDCDEECLLLANEKLNCEVAIHAEANAIYFAARAGISIQGSRLYTTTSPCLKCAHAIIQAGIISIIFETLYRNDEPLIVLAKNKISIAQYDPESPNTLRYNSKYQAG